MAASSMPFLVDRLGEDSVHKLEAAASRRFAEAESLRERGFTVGAVYLYGYVAETRLKAAYFGGVMRFAADKDITRKDREQATDEAYNLSLMSKAPHDILGWARFLVFKQKQQKAGYSRQLEAELKAYALDLYSCWRPALRYRVTVIYPSELRTVRASANWFEAHYHELRR